MAVVPPIDIAFSLPRTRFRATQELVFEAQALAGKVTTWRWDFGEGESGKGMTARHTFAEPGASPTNPVWVVPVGPGTNVASAILQARDEGLELHGRLRSSRRAG